jgi:hypothetical protein
MFRTHGFPATDQDFSLVSDIALMPDIGQGGLKARYKTSKGIMKTTMSGDMRLRASHAA